MFKLLYVLIIFGAATAEKDWWKSSTIYQIYPKSFKDTNGDGLGDLNGIIEKLSYIKWLGVDAIWLSPIFKSPQFDSGYDISDFRDIDPIYGDLKTFARLVKEAHARGLKVILDYVPNHTSHLHDWFQKALEGNAQYKDYYVWANGTGESKKDPPNNWISVFTHSAWEWNEKLQQFYLHQFLKQQPDLNYLNPFVRKEMKDIISYWLDEHNVDGVRIDAVPHLVEAKNLTDEPKSNDPNASNIDYGYLDHIFTKNQPETYDVIYDWRSHLDSISATKPYTKVMFTEAAADLDDLMRYYGTPDGSKLGAHFSFNFMLLGLTGESTAGDLLNLIKEWNSKLSSIYTSNWLLGNHDNHRIASKVGKEKVDGLNMLVGFLPGVQITYNGEEIGMEDGEVICETQGVDMADNCTAYPNLSRDFERTPFQWDSSKFAGFTDGNTTWLPVSDKKSECNVQDQLNNTRSHLHVYKKLQQLRKMVLGSYTKLALELLGENQTGISIVRTDEKNECYHWLAFNFGSENINLNITEKVIVAIPSSTSKRFPMEIIKKDVVLQPNEALILSKEAKHCRII